MSIQTKILKQGWLKKWTNYFKGYCYRWFVLTNDALGYRYYQEEDATGSTKFQDYLPLEELAIPPSDHQTKFIANNETENKTFYFKATSHEERLQWITAINEAQVSKEQRAFKSKYQESTNSDTNERCSIEDSQERSCTYTNENTQLSTESVLPAKTLKPPLSREKKHRQRRQCIPPKPQNNGFSMWFLTLGNLPLSFFEPLSMIQRVTEQFENSAILDRASQAADSCEQLALVAAFTVSGYRSSAIRSHSPFTPLLGETFECDREDLGFRCISEQVSQNPPTLAQFAESTNGLWTYWQDFSYSHKYGLSTLKVEPHGISHLIFKGSGNHYTWHKVKTVVSNLLSSERKVDHVGDVSIFNQTNGETCHLKFVCDSSATGIDKRVTGDVINRGKIVQWRLSGKWDSEIEGFKMISTTNAKKNDNQKCSPSIRLWQATAIAPEAKTYYNFSAFACELNEMEEDIAPTDSRQRPDQRRLEEGFFDQATREKTRLEKKSNSTTTEREKSQKKYTPVWFKEEGDKFNEGLKTFVYKGGYWESKKNQNWSMCPNIF
ncbi:hypothetical protein TCAL_11861 [Tigriopus californicus]|uniref:PH domain-containing protein n=1 Tax=Tigriopus californicus TaxID=6832 RepID=A0A553PDR0_TIGCA|nr:oxysterol-binding protein 1-like [Tigriopus californicus]XP_059098887.1 oxysterol-binding protein 1-like [Tigriopus californicus]TRY75821.1 hypothetical protein TCAL_11861 [Tigriopus californicus]|eukprot:TCALIF_11861-PA protein Name:"Similar to Osbp2 Oxysterol-binding protein 2 (Mus musculus)" AED:0.00 eAED:0.00 QI:0/-1/0/1/-1/1/1/0/549